MSTTMSQKPVKTFRSGIIKAAVWSKEKTHQGRTYIDYSISLEKSYKDDDGNWQQTDTFFPDELPRVCAILDEAYRFINVKVEG